MAEITIGADRTIGAVGRIRPIRDVEANNTGKYFSVFGESMQKNDVF